MAKKTMKMKLAKAAPKRNMPEYPMYTYAIRDDKAGRFGPPFTKATEGEATRDFQMLARDEKSTVSQFPGDYDLYQVAEYNDVTGKITPLETIRIVMKGINATGK